MIFEFAQKWQDFYGGAYMRISVKLRGRTEHIKEKKRAPPRVSDKYKREGTCFSSLNLASTSNDYSRASSRKLRLLKQYIHSR